MNAPLKQCISIFLFAIIGVTAVSFKDAACGNHRKNKSALHGVVVAQATATATAAAVVTVDKDQNSHGSYDSITPQQPRCYRKAKKTLQLKINEMRTTIDTFATEHSAEAAEKADTLYNILEELKKIEDQIPTAQTNEAITDLRVRLLVKEAALSILITPHCRLVRLCKKLSSVYGGLRAGIVSTGFFLLYNRSLFTLLKQVLGLPDAVTESGCLTLAILVLLGIDVAHQAMT
jgi:hypothetical protein